MLLLRQRVAGAAVRTIVRAATGSCRFASDSLIDCSKVIAVKDTFGGVGAFAATRIKKGEIVERGVVRRLPVDGNTCPYVFTWSKDRSAWASGSGCSVFYNASLDGSSNTEMKRHLDEDRFEIFALRDIEEGEEVTHLYKSIEWRDCFKELKDLRENISAGKVAASPPGRVSTKDSWVDCSKAYLKHDAWGGIGAFAAVPIKKGELVEKGIVRRLPVDGNLCPFVFTWSEDRSMWASGSGTSVFYNASLDGKENTDMKRFFDEDRFEIYATRDIAKGEELTHLYKSIEWRDCFKDLKAIYDAGKKKAGSSVSSSSDERELMKEYWDKDHGAPTLENMMLDSDAGSMDRLERPEILSALPSITGKRILELGAGIGRFSGVLAQKAGEVVAVDFVESSCAENRRVNAQYNNLTVLAEDVTALEVDPHSFDLVFSNWLLMYLTDDEVRDVAKRMLAALKPGGHLFFRESCYHSSGDVTRRFNPTKYRDPETYAQIFSECVLQDGSRFQLLATNCVESYAKLKGNMHQMWFRWQKVGEGQLRQNRLLSTGQYTSAHCLRYEKIYGRNYIYTGGDEISQRLLDNCKDWVKPGSRVLDIGAGLGGTVLYFAEKCPDIFLHAVCSLGDLASFNTGRHIRREPHVRQRVTFELAPESGIPEDELKYPPNSFDLAIIRETLMFLEEQDKAILMQKVHRLLRPGGRLVVVDYCAGKPVEEMCPTFREHLQEWNYYVIAAAKQQELLERYFAVESWESTPDFVKYMDEGLRNIDTHFGPQAPERQGRTTADEVEKARDAIAMAVRAGLPKLPEAAASDAAEAALSKLALHLEADAAEAKQCESSHEWATHIWNLERKAATEGDLSWNFFVATKPQGSA